MNKTTIIVLIAIPLLLFTTACSSDKTQTSTKQSVDMQDTKPDSEVHNPYIVKAEPILNEQESSLTIDQIKKLEIIVESDHEELMLEYEMKNHGSSMLKLKNSYMDMNVSGAIAKEKLKEFMNQWGIFNLLHKILVEPTAKVHINPVQSLKKLQLETFDGKKIELDKNKVKVQFKGKE